jgi:dTDP-glucose pyrophosphorylase
LKGLLIAAGRGQRLMPLTSWRTTAPGSAADIPIDEAYAKLRNEALAAELLRARFR